MRVREREETKTGWKWEVYTDLAVLQISGGQRNGPSPKTDCAKILIALIIKYRNMPSSVELKMQMFNICSQRVFDVIIVTRIPRHKIFKFPEAIQSANNHRVSS